jgi:hypothetical protein
MSAAAMLRWGMGREGGPSPFAFRCIKGDCDAAGCIVVGDNIRKGMEQIIVPPSVDGLSMTHARHATNATRTQLTRRTTRNNTVIRTSPVRRGSPG